MKKIQSCKKVRDTADRHRYYLKNRHSMIRILMVQEYKAHHILAVIGTLTLTTLLIPRIHNLETELTSNEGDNSFGDNIGMRWKR